MEVQKTQNRQNRLWRILLLLLLLLTIISLLGDFAAWLIRLHGGLSFSVNHAATIGIIGGADGPTAIFVTASGAPLWQIMLKLFALTLSLLGLKYLKKRK